MARIEKVEPSIDFKNLCTHQFAEKEKKDCAVKAVAIACGVAYREAKERLESLGRKSGKGTPRALTEAAIKSFGFSIKKWSFAERLKLIQSYPSPHHKLHSITSHHPRRFREAWLPMENKNLLLFARGHVFSYKNGMVQDWAVNTSLRIQEIWEITR